MLRKPVLHKNIPNLKLKSPEGFLCLNIDVIKICCWLQGFWTIGLDNKQVSCKINIQSKKTPREKSLFYSEIKNK